MFVALFLTLLGAVNSRFQMEHFVKEISEQKMREIPGKVNECKICLDVTANIISDVLNIFLSKFK